MVFKSLHLLEPDIETSTATPLSPHGPRRVSEPSTDTPLSRGERRSPTDAAEHRGILLHVEGHGAPLPAGLQLQHLSGYDTLLEKTVPAAQPPSKLADTPGIKGWRPRFLDFLAQKLRRDRHLDVFRPSRQSGLGRSQGRASER